MGKRSEESGHSMPQKEVTAGGGVLYRLNRNVTQVLLIYRRELWDLPKGGIEQGESLEDGACREVEEETGCGELRIRFSLGQTVHTYEENGTRITKTTWWFAMQSDNPDPEPQIEEQITRAEWVDLDDAITRVGFDNLKEVLSRFVLTISQRTV